VKKNKESSMYSAVSLPFSAEAEQSVLGAILLDSECFDSITEILPRADYFYLNSHKLIYNKMLEMYTQGENIDFITVLNKLKQESSFDKETGKNYLMQLAQIVPAISGITDYANIVRDKYDVRTLIITAREIIEEACDGERDSGELLDKAEQKIFDIRQKKDTQSLQPVNIAVKETLNRLDLLNSSQRDLYKPLSTGISGLDEVITGLNRSDLILLAARPGMGKTSFALNIAKYAAVNNKKKVAFFSLEMAREQLVSRLLANHASIEGTRIRLGKLSDTEWTRLTIAGNELSNSNMYFDDTPGITVPEMKAKLRRLKNVDLVVVDYLQLMSGVKRTDNRVQEISEITRNLKIMAKEINVPVLTLSQLSRASEQRADHRPLLSDLRDSGSIEQDADIVLFLYRPEYYRDSQESNNNKNISSGEIIVAKNRHGEIRSVKINWQGEFMRFTSPDNYLED